jgi:LemA protein
MKKIIGLVVVGLAILWAGSSLYSTYNRLVPLEERVNTAYADVQAQLQRRYDLLPNLAKAAEKYANIEKATFTEVAEARAGLGALQKMKPEDLAKNPELQKQFVEANAKAEQALMNMKTTIEKYPDLKSSPLFRDVMVSVEGTENRVFNSRRGTFKLVQEYNGIVRVLPTKLFASILGFHPLPQFAADAAAKNAPELFK